MAALPREAKEAISCIDDIASGTMPPLAPPLPPKTSCTSLIALREAEADREAISSSPLAPQLETGLKQSAASVAPGALRPGTLPVESWGNMLSLPADRSPGDNGLKTLSLLLGISLSGLVSRRAVSRRAAAMPTRCTKLPRPPRPPAPLSTEGGLLPAAAGGSSSLGAAAVEEAATEPVSVSKPLPKPALLPRAASADGLLLGTEAFWGEPPVGTAGPGPAEAAALTGGVRTPAPPPPVAPGAAAAAWEERPGALPLLPMEASRPLARGVVCPLGVLPRLVSRPLARGVRPLPLAPKPVSKPLVRGTRLLTLPALRGVRPLAAAMTMAAPTLLPPPRRGVVTGPATGGVTKSAGGPRAPVVAPPALLPRGAADAGTAAAAVGGGSVGADAAI
mmetsp:Transcript_1246/g.5107  ORF Transcript_1246/g.5107 Transcript_1246/m.5107 type:complete len:392 (-) Transcript_1246:421-1596(-)